MSRGVFQSAIQLVNELRTMCTIGGGEPTLHPDFKELVTYAVQNLPQYPEGLEECVPSIHCVTNGKLKGKALWLVDQAKRHRLSVRLSQDWFHEPIHHDVVHAYDPKYWNTYDEEHPYTYPYTEEDKKTIWIGHNKLHSVHAHGRGANIPNSHTLGGKCLCGAIFVQPDGGIYSCGCLCEQIGHVDNLSAAIDLIKASSGDEYEIGEYCGHTRIENGVAVRPATEALCVA